jgi:cell division protein FtsL
MEKKAKTSDGFRKSLLVLVFIMAGLAVIWLRTEVTNIEYAFTDLVKEKQRILRTRQTLEAEIERLSAAKRVADIATNKLGMTLSPRENIIYLKKTQHKQHENIRPRNAVTL